MEKKLVVSYLKKIQKWSTTNWLVLASVSLIIFLFFFFFSGLIWPLILSTFGLVPAVMEASRKADNRVKTIEYFADKKKEKIAEEHYISVKKIKGEIEQNKKNIDELSNEELKKSLLDEIK